jgi:hypothetical protein
VIRVLKKWRDVGGTPGRFSRLYAFILEGTVYTQPPSAAPDRIEIPRDAVDRLCGFLQAELQFSERMEREERA